MRIFKTQVPFDRKNGFFIKVLIGILVFCLLLTSFIFVMLYKNVERRSIEQSYAAEQEVISNVSYSASIMQDTAESMLSQLSGDPKLLQLIYSMDTESLATIHAMQLLQNYAKASAWPDSVYIYCANENQVCYSYAVNGRHALSFCALDDFFDDTFIRQLCEANTLQDPIMRTAQYRPELPEKVLFTYVLPVQNSVSSYNGFFIVNISAEQLLNLGYNMANSVERQLLILDETGHVYTSGQLVVNTTQQNPVIQEILNSGLDSGQSVVREEDAIYTWTRSKDTGLYFLSCVKYSSITYQLKELLQWFVLFYIAIVLFSALISVYLSFSINREYTRLQQQYTLAEKRYADNYSYIKHAILRSFFTLKSGDFVIGKQFSDNGITLEKYSGFTLYLFQLRLQDISDDEQNLRYPRTHFMLQEQIKKAIPQNMRFELVDMLQSRFLLVCEQSNADAARDLSEKLHDVFAQVAQFTVSGVYSDSVSSVDQLPEAYRSLAGYLDYLYFYPADGIVACSVLDFRDHFGQRQAEQVVIEAVQALSSQSFDKAAQILGSFFDAWFEPLTDIPYTLDILTAGISEYITTFKRAYAVTMEYSPSRFRSDLLRAESSRSVKRLFLELIQDISFAFASIHDRSNYIDELIRLIETNYTDPKLNIDTLADSVGLSPSHIQNIFKAATGTSISVYLRTHRLNKATELLEKTDVPISEIAEKTGFGNANYFYTVFKRYYSITPTEYRAKRPNMK